MKVVINKCFGGFRLSEAAYNFLDMEWDGYGYAGADERTDWRLVECVETLGKKANGEFSELKVVEIPDDVEWYIEDYDGWESIHEKHRVWQ